MDVVLDTNILVADPWLTSKRLGALRDYITKTRGRLILLEAVEMEFRAHVHRNVQSGVAEAASSLKNAIRFGVVSLPQLALEELVGSTMERWDRVLENFFGSPASVRPKADGSIISELLTRAANRSPPVNASGKETRDAIVWLSMLAFLRSRQWPEPAAFISANTRDFAHSDDVSLRPELARDLEDLKGAFEYHPSLESFLRVHAAPVEHVSLEWVRARVDMDIIREKVADALTKGDARTFFRLSSADYRDYYEPLRVVSVADLAVELEDVYVYELKPGSINVFLDFEVNGEFDVDCTLVRHPPYGGWDYHVGELDPFRTITADVAVKASLDAVVKDDKVIVGDVAELGRR